MTEKGLLLVASSAVATVVANLLMRAGIERLGGIEFIPRGLLKLILEPRVAFGFLVYGAAVLVWFRVIATEELSTSYPLLVGLTFVLITLGAITLFGERVNVPKLAGMALILIGVVVVARS